MKPISIIQSAFLRYKLTLFFLIHFVFIYQSLPAASLAEEVNKKSEDEAYLTLTINPKSPQTRPIGDETIYEAMIKDRQNLSGNLQDKYNFVKKYWHIFRDNESISGESLYFDGETGSHYSDSISEPERTYGICFGDQSIEKISGCDKREREDAEVHIKNFIDYFDGFMGWISKKSWKYLGEASEVKFYYNITDNGEGSDKVGFLSVNSNSFPVAVHFNITYQFENGKTLSGKEEKELLDKIKLVIFDFERSVYVDAGSVTMSFAETLTPKGKKMQEVVDHYNNMPGNKLVSLYSPTTEFSRRTNGKVSKVVIEHIKIQKAN